MEVRFRHWIKNKTSYCDFLSHNTDFFHRITRYKLAILTLFFLTIASLYHTILTFLNCLFYSVAETGFYLLYLNFEKKSGLWVYISKVCGEKSQNCEFISQKSVGKKVRTVSLYLKNLWRKKSELWVYISKICGEKSQNCEFISQKSVEKKVRIVSLYLKNLWRKKSELWVYISKVCGEKKVRIVSLYLKSLWGKKSEYFLYYSVAETGFHTHFRYLGLSKKKIMIIKYKGSMCLSLLWIAYSFLNLCI